MAPTRFLVDSEQSSWLMVNADSGVIPNTFDAGEDMAI